MLIAGKGHKTYQEVAGKIPFDDVQVVVNEYKNQQKRYIEEFRYDDFYRSDAKDVEFSQNIGHQRFDLNRYRTIKKVCGLSHWLAIDLMHTILDQARGKGCAGVIARYVPEDWDRGFVSFHTLIALQNLTRFARDRFTGPVVGITGSAEATTVK